MASTTSSITTQTTGSEQLLRRVPSALAVPPMLVQPGVEKLDSPVAVPSDTDFPPPTFTRARYDSQNRRFPQCIAHRGFKAKFAENTMPSFRGAVAAGTHALETDVHVTKDEVVVLSHDPSLKRCFGVDRKIKECNWDEIAELRTLSEIEANPGAKYKDGQTQGEPMPRLKDLLEYMAQPGLEDIWLLLDIKLSNDPTQIMRLLGTTIASVPPTTSPDRKHKPWSARILLGIWAAKYLPLAIEHLPNFPVSNIGFSGPYARHFFTLPNISFNMLLPMLIAPGGRSFIRAAQSAPNNRQIYAWTVNDKDRMAWCIRRQLDGICTDDVEGFLKVCKEWKGETTPGKIRWWQLEISVKSWWEVIRIWTWIMFARVWMRKFMAQFQPVASRELIRKSKKN